MTVHRAAWALRAAVVAALGAGMLTVAAAPAHADHDVRLAPIGNVEVQAGGGTQNVQVLVENRDQPPHLEDGTANVQITMTVPGGIGAVIQSAPNGCSLGANNTRMDCTAEIPAGGTFSGVAQIGANGNAPVEAGQSATDVGEIFLNTGAQQQFNVKVNGPDRAPVVAEVSGIVTEVDTGEPVEGARVILKDGQGVDHEKTTDANGNFRFTTDDNIAAGNIALRASKDGYEFGSPPTLTLGPEQSETGVRLALTSLATPSPSATPTATPTATASATASAAPVAVDETASGGGFFTTLLIVLGVLFVALGIGAIVLLIIRQRRRAREEEEGEGPDGAAGMPPGPRGPRPAPGSHGAYHPTPTQVAGAGNAQTQVIGPGGGLPAVGPRPALANSPTMMQRGAAGPAADETAMLPRADGPPGPAGPAGPGGPGSPTGLAAGSRSPGTPPAPRPAPAAEPGPYGAGYGSPAAAPGSGGGYRGERPAYGAYDQPTGRHERPGYPAERPAYPAERPAYPTERPRHESEASSYGPDPYTQPPPGPETRYDDRGYDPRGADPRGADPRGGYDRGGYDNRGYEPQGYDNRGYEPQGYDNRAYDHQGYEARGYEPQGYDHQGYDRTGYDGQGYDQQGYQQGPGYDGRGYDDRGGYGPGGGEPGYEPPPEQRRGDEYYDDQDSRPRHSGSNERRRLDWLD